MTLSITIETITLGKKTLITMPPYADVVMQTLSNLHYYYSITTCSTMTLSIMTLSLTEQSKLAP